MIQEDRDADRSPLDDRSRVGQTGQRLFQSRFLDDGELPRLIIFPGRSPHRRSKNFIHRVIQNRFIGKLTDRPSRSDGFDDRILGANLIPLDLSEMACGVLIPNLNLNLKLLGIYGFPFFHFKGQRGLALDLI